SANAAEYSELPTRWPIRRIVLRARPAVKTSPSLQNAHSINAQMATIELLARSGQTRIYNGSLEVLGWLASSEFGRDVVTRGEVMRAPDDHFDCGIGYVTAIAAAASQVDDPAGVYPGTIIRADTQLSSQYAWDVESASPIEFVARGFAYLHTLPLFVATKPDLADVLDVEHLKQVNVNITPGSGTFTGASVNAESAIVLSRLVQ
ncbi:hypothetical protein LCGC14_2282030, partial [marine sediment metagenome]